MTTEEYNAAVTLSLYSESAGIKVMDSYIQHRVQSLPSVFSARSLNLLLTDYSFLPKTHFDKRWLPFLNSTLTCSTDYPNYRTNNSFESSTCEGYTSGHFDLPYRGIDRLDQIMNNLPSGDIGENERVDRVFKKKRNRPAINRQASNLYREGQKLHNTLASEGMTLTARQAVDYARSGNTPKILKEVYTQLQDYYSTTKLRGVRRNRALKMALIHKMLTEVKPEFYNLKLDQQNEVLSYLLLDDIWDDIGESITGAAKGVANAFYPGSGKVIQGFVDELPVRKMLGYVGVPARKNAPSAVAHN